MSEDTPELDNATEPAAESAATATQKQGFFASLKTIAAISQQTYGSPWFWVLLLAMSAVSSLGWAFIYSSLYTDSFGYNQLRPANQVTMVFCFLGAALATRAFRSSAEKRTAVSVLGAIVSKPILLAVTLVVAYFLLISMLLGLMPSASGRWYIGVLIILIMVYAATVGFGVMIKAVQPGFKPNTQMIGDLLRPRFGLGLFGITLLVVGTFLGTVLAGKISSLHALDGFLRMMGFMLAAPPVLAFGCLSFLGADPSAWVADDPEDSSANEANRVQNPRSRIPRGAWIGAGGVAALLLAFFAGSIMNAPAPVDIDEKPVSPEAAQKQPPASSLADTRAAKIDAARMARSLYEAKNYPDAYKQALFAATDEGGGANADAQYLLWKLGWDPAGIEKFEMPETRNPMERAKASAERLNMMPKIPLLTKENSIEWLQKAAEQDHVRANADLGVQYFLGSSVTPQNYVTGIEYILFAADRNDAIAQKNLAVAYGRGLGVAKDAYTAFSWYKKAADNGNAEAGYYTADWYRTGFGTQKSLPLSVTYYRKSAKGGNKDAQFQLGYQLMEGLGTAKDHRVARYWTAMAAKQGDVAAIRNLGYIYDKGLGVREDKTRAFELYVTAAEGGDMYGAYNAGISTWNMLKFDTRGNKIVRKYLNMAKDRGHPDAASALVDYNRGARIVNSVNRMALGSLGAVFTGGAKGLEEVMNKQYRFIDQIIEQAVEQ